MKKNAIKQFEQFRESTHLVKKNEIKAITPSTNNAESIYIHVGRCSE